MTTQTQLDLQSVLAAVKSALPAGRPQYALHEPSFQGKEWEYVKDCIDTGWVSSVGQYVNRFEAKLTEITGIPYAIAAVNGTAALHIALKLAGVEAGDEVLMPSLTFVATANAAAYCGAVPHFVDVCEKTLGVDPVKLEAELKKTVEIRNCRAYNPRTGRCIKALIVMHAFGHPVDLDPIAQICKKYGIELIEDAAEALGSYYKGKHVGHAGKFTVLSFNGNKIVTTGGGGAILTSDKTLAEKAKHLTTTAKVPHAWDIAHDEVGYNYRLPNLNAALGLAQLEELGNFAAKKRKIAEAYQKAFENVPGVKFAAEPENTKSNYWLNVILLDAEFKSQRDALLALLHENKIMARPAWTLMHKLPMYANCPKMNLEVSEEIEARLINLPSSVSLAA